MKNEVFTPEQEARIVALIRAELARPVHFRPNDSLDRLIERLIDLGIVINRPGVEQQGDSASDTDDLPN